MSDTKTTTARKAPVMGPRGWLNKSMHLSGKKTAEGFIAEHREFLEQGELASLLSPILAAVDSKDLLPTPALTAMQNLVLGFVLESEIKAGEKAMAKGAEGGSTGTRKPWVATIFDKFDRVVSQIDESSGEPHDLIQGFDFAQRAEGWVNRKLFAGEPGMYGLVQHATITIKGEPLTSRIERDERVFSAMMPRKPGAFMKNTASKSSALSFRPKASTTRVTFSKG